jgi:hypothetical protein
MTKLLACAAFAVGVVASPVSALRYGEIGNHANRRLPVLL